MGRLDGVVVLVTGASSGIGQSVARYLGEIGASVAINYHSQREPAEKLAEELRTGGGSAIALPGDVSQEDDVATLFEKTVEAFGRLDVLVANSGMQKDAPVAEMSLDDWKAVIDVDLTGQFLSCRQAVRQFRNQAEAARRSAPPDRSSRSRPCTIASRGRATSITPRRKAARACSWRRSLRKSPRTASA